MGGQGWLTIRCSRPPTAAIFNHTLPATSLFSVPHLADPAAAKLMGVRQPTAKSTKEKMGTSQIQSNQQSESAKDRKRHYFFGLYSKNLNFVKQDPRVHIEPDENEGFICPVCLKFFTREGLSKQFDDHLTLEDVPPESLGGKIRTLTCKICNNKQGSKLESHLGRKLKVDEFFMGTFGSSIDARFRPHKEIDLTATVYYREPGILDIRYDEKRSNPGHIIKLHNAEDSGSISEIKLVFLGKYKYNRPEIALLRIAYLWAFSFFGYGFLMNPNLNNIRYQLQNPDKTVLPHWGIMQADFPDSVLGVNLITQPKELWSFFVVFELTTSMRRVRYGVMLPGPSKPGLNIYHWLSKKESVEKNSSSTVKLYPIPEANYLEDSNLSFASHSFWNKLASEET